LPNVTARGIIQIVYEVARTARGFVDPSSDLHDPALYDLSRRLCHRRGARELQ
jgi:hypothetical protein